MASEKYTNIGKSRWENANVGVIKWDPENKAGLASVIDETTGTVYEIGGGGGGGESDFSTATVTLTNADEAELILPIMYEQGAIEDGSPATIVCKNMILPSGTYTVPLYKGALFVEIPYNVTTTGNIEATYEDNYLITGDCTITVSDSTSPA